MRAKRPSTRQKRAFVRRRPVTTVVLALVLLLAAGTTTFLLWPSAPTAPKVVTAPQNKLGPVIMVPGYGGNVAVFDRMANTLRSSGRQAYVFNPPGDARGDLRDQAKALGAFVNGLNERSVDLVGHSAGGVVIRLWVAKYGGQRFARRVVTAGSPHHGTRFAGVAKAISSGGACPVACQQLAPDSPIINDLNNVGRDNSGENADETPYGPLWTSMWTRTDDVVVPAESARLTGSVNVALQTVCADVSTSHGQLPADPLVIGIVRASIGIPAPRQPNSAQCENMRALGSVISVAAPQPAS